MVAAAVFSMFVLRTDSLTPEFWGQMLEWKIGCNFSMAASTWEENFRWNLIKMGIWCYRVSATVSHNQWSLIFVPHIIKHFFYFVHTSLRPQTVACEASWPTKPLPGAAVIY